MRHEVDVEDKPFDCVFCGDFRVQSEHYETPKHEHEYFVRCVLCEAHGPIRKSEQDAIKSWNHRIFRRIVDNPAG